LQPWGKCGHIPVAYSLTYSRGLHFGPKQYFYLPLFQKRVTCVPVGMYSISPSAAANVPFQLRGRGGGVVSYEAHYTPWHACNNTGRFDVTYRHSWASASRRLTPASAFRHQ
jgi:hypothetical protein